MRDFEDANVEAVFASYPASHKSHLITIREIILDTAEALELPEGIEETLKWGEPSYLPKKPRVGSTVRIGNFDMDHVGLYFNCRTMLVESFRSMYGDELTYSKNRAVLFKLGEPLPKRMVEMCARMALRYHIDRKIST